MSIPTIGGARGIFEIFVPGVFLLLNLGIVVYLLPFIDDETRNLISASASNPALILVIAVSLGYLIGVLLRLFRTDLPDKWSAGWLRRFDRHARQANGEFNLWASEKFPYIGWIGEVCKKYLPPEALTFYDKIWAPRKREGQNRQFFNFCKVMINSNDGRSANEIYAAEALSRYIAGMFYALVCSSSLLLVVVILRYIFLGQVMVNLVVLLLAYFSAITIMLGQFRLIRVKEVEIVFAASFRNKAIFEGKTPAAPVVVKGTPSCPPCG